MTVLRDRIRILQRQVGNVTRAPDTAPNLALRDVRTELRRLLRWRGRSAAHALPAPAGEEIATGVRFVESLFPVDGASPIAMPWGEPEPVQRHRIVCFDTETTGLSGGVGTKAFMIGATQWETGAIRVRQWYLTALAGEQAMLRAFADSLPELPVFVSYNGRSYDAPLLRGRYRIHRQPQPFDQQRHVDLLYPTRRRYRGRWENCRLQTIERNVLGIVREDDLPGSEAPAAWLTYLRGHSAENLRRVLAHNAQDIRTLVLLLDHLSMAQEGQMDASC